MGDIKLQYIDIKIRFVKLLNYLKILNNDVALFLKRQYAFNQKQFDRLISHASETDRLISEFVHLPYGAVQKAALAVEYYLAVDGEAIRKEIDIVSSHAKELLIVGAETMSKRAGRFFGGLLFSFRGSPISAEQIRTLEHHLEYIVKNSSGLSLEGFVQHIYGRCHLQSDRITANFVFFRKETHPLVPLFMDARFAAFVTRTDFRHLTFQECYKKISAWFFDYFIIWTFNKKRQFIESYFGPNPRLNLVIYFTAGGEGNNFFFVKAHVGAGSRRQLSSEGAFESGDLRVFVNLNILFLAISNPSLLAQIQSAFFHELVHLFHFQRQMPSLKVASHLKNEGLALFAQFSVDPSNIIAHYGNSYSDEVKKASKNPLKLQSLTAEKEAELVHYELGLHMWLAIYLSKLNLDGVNLSNLSEYLAQFTQGAYSQLFHAWFLRFRNMSDDDFIKQYTTAVKKLRIMGVLSL